MIAEAIVCLALNAYHEARDQGHIGQVAVSQVVMNRVASEHYPDTVCEVVFQGPTRPSWKNPEVDIPIRNRCQFSWWCDGKDDTPYDEEAWAEAKMVAWGVYHETVYDQVDGALWYHADYVTPGWASSKSETTRIGNHIFYGWKHGTD